LVILRFLVELLLIVLVVRALIRVALPWLTKKPSAEKRYEPKKFEIDKSEIVDGDFKDIEK